MLEYVLNTSADVFFQYCSRREGLRRAVVLRSIYQAIGGRPRLRWTWRGQLNEGVMFGELRILLLGLLLVICMGGCVSEYRYDVILARRLWSVEKDV